MPKFRVQASSDWINIVFWYSMRKSTWLALALVVGAGAQESRRPEFDPRLTVHTLVREDIFAGFLVDDMERFARGEKTLERLLLERPEAKPAILTWQAGATLKHALIAQKQNRTAEFEQLYRRSLSLFAEALRLAPDSPDVAAVTGGSYAVLADQLPEKYRLAAWSKAYDAYQVLWKLQAPLVDQAPLHIKGELLAGLAQSAQRSGRVAELPQYLALMLQYLPNSAYAARAREWKDKPEVAAHTKVTCQSCHEPGRLAAQTAALAKLSSK
jgi:hypothetical protein